MVVARLLPVVVARLLPVVVARLLPVVVARLLPVVIILTAIPINKGHHKVVGIRLLMGPSTIGGGCLFLQVLLLLGLQNP